MMTRSRSSPMSSLNMSFKLRRLSREHGEMLPYMASMSVSAHGRVKKDN